MNGIFRKNLPYCEALIISGEMPACVREEEKMQTKTETEED